MRFWRIFIVSNLIIANLIFAATTRDKISDNEDGLKSAKKMETQLNKKLEELANDIIRGESSVKATAEQIGELEIQVKNLEESAKSASAELNVLTSQNSQLIKSQKDMEERLVKIISEDFAYDLIAPSDYAESEESIIAGEVIRRLGNAVQGEVKKIVQNYANTANLIKTQSAKIDTIKFDLKEFKTKQDKLKALKTKQERALASLKQDKDIYSKKLEKLQAQQDEMRKTLERLKILAKKEDEEAARKQAQSAKKDKNNSNLNGGDVRQVGSSYKAGSVKKYTGAKTIAPLDDFSVKQKFGDYTDPIYNIKIFNESIVLRSNIVDARVKSVLPGKVVFAKDTAVLDKVVIVENDGGMHTIYAHLSKIAPTVKVGTKVKKGYVIGRVERDLTFEVTQQNYHINPLDLISLR